MADQPFSKRTKLNDGSVAGSSGVANEPEKRKMVTKAVKEKEVNYLKESSTLDGINDQCFFDICSSLNIIDLANLSRTNIRCNDLVNRYINSKMNGLNNTIYANQMVTELINSSLADCLNVFIKLPNINDFCRNKFRMIKSSAINIADELSEIDNDKLVNFLQRFGRFVYTFFFDGPNGNRFVLDSYYSNVVRLVAGHCPNLIGFTFHRCSSLDPLALRYLYRFKNIRMLTISDCFVNENFRFQYSNGIFVDLPKLESLTLNNSFDILNYNNFFPHLKYYKLLNENMLFDEKKLHTFIGRHTTLKEISFVDIDYMSSAIFPIIAEKNVALEKLTFKCNSSSTASRFEVDYGYLELALPELLFVR